MHSVFKALALSMTVSLALISTSCITVDKTLGADNVPDEQALHLQTATFHLPLRTKMMDDIQALSTSSAVVGAFRTEEFGLAHFSFATNYAPYYTTKKLNWGTNRKIKSAYLTIQKSSTKILDDAQEGLPQNFHVYRMNRVVDTTSRYAGDLKPSDYNHTPVDTGSVVYTGSDTLRIWLKNSFGQDLLNATQLELDSSSRFMDRFKALYFTCDPPEEGTTGGRLNIFSTTGAYIYLTFSFQPTWQSGLAVKDTTVLIPLGDNTYTQNFSTYESQPLESEEEKEYIYVEGIGGLKAYVDPSVLKDTLDNWIAKKNYDADKLLVAKATYKLPFVTDNSTVSFINRCFPASLYPLNKTWNTSKTSYMYSPIGDIYSASNNAGSVNRSLSCYTGNISSVIQKLIGLSKDAVAANWTEYAMWFSPVSESTSSNYYSSSTTTTYSTDLTSYFIGKLNGPLHTDYPTVEVVFAVMND